MSTSRTRRRGRSAQRRLDRRWAHRFAWLLGALLVCAGALAGAFGTVAWLTVLCAPAFSHVMLGILALGVAPVAAGGALLWAGLSLLESESAKNRVRATPESRLLEAARGGATAAAIATRLGIGDTVEVERRLDELVTRDVLVLEVSEDGEVLYRSLEGDGGRPRPPGER